MLGTGANKRGEVPIKARSSIGLGRQTFNLKRGVQLPYGLPKIIKRAVYKSDTSYFVL